MVVTGMKPMWIGGQRVASIDDDPGAAPIDRTPAESPLGWS
jgi:hypothetical protein